MDKKKCFKCGDSKPLSGFYKHKEMADGYLGKCKACARIDSARRLDKKKNDPVWIAKERERVRKKQILRNRSYIGKIQMKAHNKARARKRSTPKGVELHHWSYQDDHHDDVIEMSLADHRKIHRYIKLDIDMLMFRRLDGVLMDTRESSLAEYSRILKIEED